MREKIHIFICTICLDGDMGKWQNNQQILNLCVYRVFFKNLEVSVFGKTDVRKSGFSTSVNAFFF